MSEMMFAMKKSRCYRARQTRLTRPGRCGTGGAQGGMPVQQDRFFMSTLLRRARVVPVFSIALAALLPLTAAAQNAFAPGGNDYPITGPLPGDQTMPHLALRTNGGFVVWQDNAADGNGLGIRAQRLDANFNRLGPLFRVNSIAAFDQEKPQVAALTNGGAVVVWQGGRQGFQKIYARFIPVTGTNLTPAADLMVNTYTNEYQINPAVAVLKDGNIVVVWASFGQDGDKQGIYGQRLSPTGTKLGGEFPINQYPLNNQRTPSVAALADGGFVVAWISELQRDANRSVDVYARRYNASGTALGNEFPVNPSPTRVCANPVVAAAPDGGFAVAWSQREALVNTFFSSQATVTNGSTFLSENSWDVFTRLYNAAGQPVTDPVRLNSFTYGDQYAPRIAACGSTWLSVWQSLGQDGSREGIYGQFFGAGGQLLGVEFRVNSDPGSRQLHPVVASDGRKRFLTAWTSFATSGTFDLFGRSYEMIEVTIAPIAGGVRLTWNTMPGARYQVQMSTNYTTWTNFGAVRTAAGYTDFVDVVAGQAGAVYRVVRVQ